MTEKYYVPDISEFVLGFEYEFDDCDGWKKYIVSPQTKPNLEDYEKYKNYFRVKYLDKNEIESLGWEYSGDGAISEWFYKNGKTLIFCPYYKDSVRITDFILDDVLFLGAIKNKSQLKQLMKQLNIAK